MWTKHSSVKKNLKSNSTTSIPCICYGAKHLKLLIRRRSSIFLRCFFADCPFGKTMYFMTRLQDYKKTKQGRRAFGELKITNKSKTLYVGLYTSVCVKLKGEGKKRKKIRIAGRQWGQRGQTGRGQRPAWFQLRRLPVVPFWWPLLVVPRWWWLWLVREMVRLLGQPWLSWLLWSLVPVGLRRCTDRYHKIVCRSL